METQPPNSVTSSETSSSSSAAPPSGEPIPAGTPVIYGLLGRCTIASIESRTIEGQSLQLYKLEVLKPAASRTVRRDPAIWVPVKTAKDQGLRLPMTASEVEDAYRIISNREYYFSASEPWSTIHIRLENVVRAEGGIGLAKALSYLFVIKRKQVVPTPEVARMYEQIAKLFIREISESTGKLPRVIEDELNKMLRHKLLPDN